MRNVSTNPTRRRTPWVLVASFAVLLSACKKEADLVTPATTTTAANPNAEVNNWILDNMRYYYYWNTKIPANPDLTLAPEPFFNSLLNTYNATSNPDGDRFSWIQESAEELQASLSGETTTTGMEYQLYLRASGSDDIIAQVLYVLPGSPAQKAGLKRGDIISKVNGQVLNRSNYLSLLFGNTTNFTFGLASVNNGSLVDTDVSRSVTATVFQENPVFLDSVYTVGSKKIGYLVYNQFVPGANNSRANEYDAQIDAIFSNFKAQGVNELVLDLRYNPGGYTSSSTNLASLIGKGVTTGKLFFREECNPTLTAAWTRQYGSDFLVNNFVTKPQNIGANLSRVFVLTTDHTASASELIINGLRPYMTVTTIGTTTTGKNVGSITLTDDSGKIKWGMQPIVFKSFNSLGQSDYASGFKPTIEVEEPLNLLPLGDTREPLLGTALAQITGTAPSARAGSANANPLSSIGSSIQRKAGARYGMVKPLKTLELAN
ncbi:S41 family peptidase [Spirosoma sp. 209]|uniref:S41 family peptidase n=1 Tax=Spirosoma sp. 209 TaxID=1955701 RepID=UPI00098D6B03|nr:S41 family peptidase [Spirosoma sp. 209]